jgi:hypothetical protein
VQQAAVVLTALLEGYTNDGIIQGAFSVGEQINLPDLIRIMDIAHFCIGRRCTAIHAGQVLPPNTWLRVWSGLSARVRTESPEADEADRITHELEQLNFEDLSLMQTREHSLHASHGFQLCWVFLPVNPDAPVFDPNMPLIASQAEFLQDMQRMWIQSAFSWEGEAKAYTFLKFVSPGTGQGRCLHSRRVTLFEDNAEWAAAMRRTLIC